MRTHTKICKSFHIFTGREIGLFSFVTHCLKYHSGLCASGCTSEQSTPNCGEVKVPTVGTRSQADIVMCSLLTGRYGAWALSHFVFQMVSSSSPLSRWGKASTDANDNCSGHCRCSGVGGETRNNEHQEAMFRAQSSLVWLFPATLQAGESIWPAGWYHASERID